MRSLIITLTAISLVLSLMLAPFQCVQAVTIDKDNISPPNDNGTRVIPDPDVSIWDDGIVYHELFSMEGDAIEEIVTTRWSGKKIIKSELPSGAEYLIVRGKFTHTYGSEGTMRAGICWYDIAHGYYEPVSGFIVDPIVHNTQFEGKFPISNLGTKTYYAFASNLDGSGSITGELTVYYSFA